ncbi:cubilin-like isoform X1 [Haliotis rufescens]|uniref:cubilin-like isoform X1 n=1 Tax=Haliotis rufescens TaxID=6454 RepID=UPI00201F5509|nr:cubilin-like isoform X1 [Haliotis rufescens]
MSVPTLELKMQSHRPQLLDIVVTATVFLCTRILGQSAESGCNTVVVVSDTAKHTVKSAGYPLGYQQNTDCKWRLDATRMFNQNKTIKLRFIVDIEDSSDCSGESVTVHAFTSPRNTKLAVLCGNVKKKRYEFFIESLLVVFKTGSSPSLGRQGFKMVYQMIDETSCSERLFSTERKLVLSSLGYPQPYPSFQRCTYLIRTSTPDYNVRLDVLQSALGTCRDAYVMVYDGDSEQGPLLGKWCGFQKPKFLSLVQQLYVVFVSQDNSLRRTGFTANYYDAMCGGTVHTDYYKTGEIVFPGYSSPFSHYIKCRWYLNVPKSVSKFLVAFRNVQVDCPFSRISVYEGPSDTDFESTWDICDKENYTFLVSGPSMFIKFKNQGSLAGPSSFRINYRGYSNTACFQKGEYGKADFNTAKRKTQILMSPGYPEMYPDRIQCVWKVRADDDMDVIMVKVVELNLHPKPTCSDSVRLYNGYLSDLNKKPDMILCDTEKKVFYSESPSMTIVFSTNEVGIGTGFKIEYQSTVKPELERTASVYIRATIIATTCGITAVIFIIIVVIIWIKRRSDRTPQTPVVQTTCHPHPPPQTRDQATPFLPTNTPGNTVDPTAPPPSYQDVNYLPVTDPSTPPMLPPSYEDAVTKGMIEKDTETRF